MRLQLVHQVRRNFAHGDTNISSGSGEGDETLDAPLAVSCCLVGFHLKRMSE